MRLAKTLHERTTNIGIMAPLVNAYLLTCIPPDAVTNLDTKARKGLLEICPKLCKIIGMKDRAVPPPENGRYRRREWGL